MRTFNGTVAVAVLVVLAGVAGTGLVVAEDLESATDGDLSNGEELESAEDDDDQVYPINYTFRLANNQPGAVDGAAEHYAVGLTENGTLHRVLLYSPDMGFSNCEPGDTSAFGIDRGNNDPGTGTDVSLLTSFKSYNSTEDFIDITYYREETLAGEPVNGSVYDQIVAAQGNCYDNPSEPGWYRINGTITGNVAGGTETDYRIRDLSNYFYICDCDSRAAAEETLGPPPNESGDGGDGSDGTDGSSTPARTTTPTATAAPSDGNATTATPTATAAPSDDDATTATSTPTAAPSDEETATASPTPTAIPTVTAASAGGDTPTATAAGAGGRGTRTATPSATARGGASGQQQPGSPATPTIADGPGFGSLTALLGALLATVVLARRD